MLADFLSRYINYVFCLLVLWERQGLRQALPFWLRVALALTIAVGLAKLGKALPIWPGHPGFPSGHTAFSITCTTMLFLRRGPRWLILGLILTALMMVSLIYGRWHSLGDTLGALALGTSCALAVWHLTHQSRNAR